MLKTEISAENILSCVFFIPPSFVFFFGSYMVINDSLRVGSMVALLSYVSALFSPIREISAINLEMQKFLSSLRRLSEITFEDAHIKQSSTTLNKITNGLDLKGVSLSYSGKKKLFDHLDLKIPLGSVLRISGSNGTGKTSLIDVITGIIEPSEGAIYYDGLNLKKISCHSIKKILGVVSQSTYLFSDTVRGNILLGRDIGDKEILELGKKIGCRKILESEELNLDTVVSAGGSNLSGGQCKKICIMRALVHNPQIIILDEPSSFLDAEIKEAFFKYIDSIRHERIILLITHEDIPLLKPDSQIILGGQEIAFYKTG